MFCPYTHTHSLIHNERKIERTILIKLDKIRLILEKGNLKTLKQIKHNNNN